MKIVTISPAFNEEGSVGHVVNDIPKDIIDEVVIVNNNSTDNTVEVATKAGATVLTETKKGYGIACLKGIRYFEAKPKDDQPDIVVFIDADYSDHPDELPKIIAPILNDDVDMVIGSRALGVKEKGAMMPQQIFGNWLATTLIRWFYNYEFTDLGPFRAIKWDKLQQLKMEDETFGWTVEMQVKAARHKLKCTEVPVKYRKRIGVSKVTGTIYGSVMAGYKILWTIFRYL